MKTLYQRECPVCGTLFETPTKIRVYCDKHQKNGARELAKLEARQRRTRLEEISNELISFSCEYCGREHVATRSLLSKLRIHPSAKHNWNGAEHLYCCIQHKELDQRDHSTCDNCGKSLKDSEFEFSASFKYNYCSMECKQAHKEKLELDKQAVFTCQHCGKEFRRKAKKAYFCSNKCTQAARLAGWKNPDKQDTVYKDPIIVTRTCSQCGKPFQREFTSQFECAEFMTGFNAFCSDECSTKYSEHFIAVRKQEKEKEKQEKAKAKQLQPGESLCIMCKTSYKDCERMQSNFRILPKGAHYDSKGVLVTCPKFK